MTQPQAPAPFPYEVVEKLGAYVYILCDPRTSVPFYVGKGRGSRVYHHVWTVMGEPQRIESSDVAADTPDSVVTTSAKNEHIRNILDAGSLPEHWIIRHGIEPGANPDKAAFAIEQALIDGLGLAYRRQTAGEPRDSLTNVMGGHVQAEHGVHLAEELALRYGAPLAPDLPHPCALLVVNEAAAPGANIYDAARCCWRAGDQMRAIPDLPIFVFASDIVREVYRATEWVLASERGATDKLWQWSGSVDSDLHARFVGTSLREVRAARPDGRWRQHGWHPYR